MSGSKRVIASIGHVYRFCADSASGLTQYTLEALYDDWEEVRCWDDPGHVAALLVKHGVARDHVHAFSLINGIGEERSNAA